MRLDWRLLLKPGDLHAFASSLLDDANPTEASVRRAVSAMYYGLFHRLTAAGATVFQAGGPALQAQAGRAFSHTAMRKVCEAYARAPHRPFQPPLDRLVPAAPDAGLAIVADAFNKLQEARHSADYALDATWSVQDGLDLLGLADAAHASFTAAEPLPETTVFLTALLLANRWTRRG